MDGKTAAQKGTLDRLLKEATEVSLALGRSNGTISGGATLFRDQGPLTSWASTRRQCCSGPPMTTARAMVYPLSPMT